MDELIKFDHAQADKLRSRLTNKTKTIQLALCRIEGLVERTADLHWEGKSRAEYIGLYKSSSAQAHNYLRRWLKEVTDLINRAKEEKEKQEEAGSVRKPKRLIEHLPDGAFKYVAGPAATADGQAAVNPDWLQSAPAGVPETMDRKLYYALVQSYAGPAKTLGYEICNDSPDDLLESLTRETCLITPEQLDVYNSVLAAGSYTDEQKRRMLVSMALETNINDLLDMDEYDKADALKGLMDRLNSQSVDVYNRFQVMLGIKWSCFNDMNESIIYAITNHAESLLLSTPDDSQSPAGYSNVEHLAKLGYTEAEISDLRSWMTDAEWEFFNKLDGTEEGYIQAFKTDPNDLSEVVTLELYRYTTRLLELDEEGNATQESCRQLEYFTNAILKSEEIYVFVAEDGTQQITTDKYSDIYLRRMYSGAAMETEGDAFMLATMDKDTQEYEELYKDYRAKYTMMSYWASQNMVIDVLKRRNGTGNTDVSLPIISNLTFDKSGAQFRVSHAGGDRIEDVVTSQLNNGLDLDDEWDLETLRKLQEAKDALWGYIIADAVKGGLLLAAGIADPPLAILAILTSLLFMVLEGKTGTVGGLESLVESEAAKIGLKTGNLVASGLINGMIKWQKANQELKIRQYQKKMEYFGMGGHFEMMSDGPLNLYNDLSVVNFTGLYDPDIIRNMYIWETEGIKGWAGLTDEECKEILDLVAKKKRGTESQVYKDCCALIYGGYDIFGIGVNGTEDGVKNDMTRFMKAVTIINRVGFSVKLNWYSHIKESKK